MRVPVRLTIVVVLPVSVKLMASLVSSARLFATSTWPEPLLVIWILSFAVGMTVIFSPVPNAELIEICPVPWVVMVSPLATPLTLTKPVPVLLTVRLAPASGLVMLVAPVPVALSVALSLSPETETVPAPVLATAKSPPGLVTLIFWLLAVVNVAPPTAVPSTDILPAPLFTNVRLPAGLLALTEPDPVMVKILSVAILETVT